MAVMPHVLAGLDGDEVDSQRERRQRRAVGELAGVAEDEGGVAQPGDLAVVNGFFGQAEVAPRSPPNLHHDEGPRRSWVDADQVELGAPHADVAAKDRPAQPQESLGYEAFTKVS